jgi:phage FluMu protein Com
VRTMKEIDRFWASNLDRESHVKIPKSRRRYKPRTKIVFKCQLCEKVFKRVERQIIELRCPKCKGHIIKFLGEQRPRKEFTKFGALLKLQEERLR